MRQSRPPLVHPSTPLASEAAPATYMSSASMRQFLKKAVCWLPPKTSKISAGLLRGPSSGLKDKQSTQAPTSHWPCCTRASTSYAACAAALRSRGALRWPACSDERYRGQGRARKVEHSHNLLSNRQQVSLDGLAARRVRR